MFAAPQNVDWRLATRAFKSLKVPLQHLSFVMLTYNHSSKETRCVTVSLAVCFSIRPC